MEFFERNWETILAGVISGILTIVFSKTPREALAFTASWIRGQRRKARREVITWVRLYFSNPLTLEEIKRRVFRSAVYMLLSCLMFFSTGLSIMIMAGINHVSDMITVSSFGEKPERSSALFIISGVLLTFSIVQSFTYSVIFAKYLTINSVILHLGLRRKTTQKQGRPRRPPGSRQ